MNAVRILAGLVQGVVQGVGIVVVARAWFKLHPLDRLSRAIDRLGCALAGGHRLEWTADWSPVDVELRLRCPDCKSWTWPHDNNRIRFGFPRQPGAHLERYWQSLKAEVARIDPTTPPLPDIPEWVLACADVMWVVMNDTTADTETLERQVNTLAHEQHWSQDDSHVDTAQVVTFGQVGTMRCWKCERRPETTDLGLCDACFEDVRTDTAQSRGVGIYAGGQG